MTSVPSSDIFVVGTKLRSKPVRDHSPNKDNEDSDKIKVNYFQ